MQVIITLSVYAQPASASYHTVSCLPCVPSMNHINRMRTQPTRRDQRFARVEHKKSDVIQDGQVCVCMPHISALDTSSLMGNSERVCSANGSD
jgi:hypothetical protein